MADKQKNKKRKTVEYGRYGYRFIAPFFIIYAIFQFAPLLYTIWVSFMENYSRGLKEVGPNFIGLKNYTKCLVGEQGLFHTFTMRAVGNTMLMWILNFIPQILLSLLLASWFTDTRVKLKGTGAYKVIMFLPNIITAASISVLFYSLFSINGPITQIVKHLGIVASNYDFMQQKTATRFIIAFIQFWMWYGNTMIILISGILGINPELFEAARVDGASSPQIFRSITLPLLRPIVTFTLVTSAIGGLQMFDIPSLFNVSQAGDGLPDFASTTITMYIRKMISTSKNFGEAGAASVILFIITLMISICFFFFLRDKGDNYYTKKTKKDRGAKA